MTEYKGNRTFKDYWITIMFLITIALPLECFRRTRLAVRETAADFKLQESDIDIVVFCEYSPKDFWSRVPLAERPLFEIDGGRTMKRLYRVIPCEIDGFPTPEYMWVQPLDEGSGKILYTPVYGVFPSADAARRWATRNGYEGEFRYGLDELVRLDKERWEHGRVHCPSYIAGNSVLSSIIYTDEYVSYDDELWKITHYDELDVYRSLL